MEKLFKRIPRVGGESEKERSEGSPETTTEPQNQAQTESVEKTPEISPEKAKKHRAWVKDVKTGKELEGMWA